MNRPTKTKDVVIVGAGPYGLSTAAYLQHEGIDPYVIGQSMSFWKQNMPKKMILRSRHEASNIAAPRPQLSLHSYQRAIGRELIDPLPAGDFIAYGDWFQKQVAPNLDQRRVDNISHNGDEFDLLLEDGERIHASSVVLTLGIGMFLQRPEQFAGIPRELAPHSSELNDLAQFAGKRVVVIGRGQSALECAALLHENNADVEILTRSPALIFRPFAWRKHLFRKLTPGPLRPLSYWVIPPTDLGDIKTARKMADPDKFRRQSPEEQEALIRACTRPIGAYWLEPRLKAIRTKTTVSVTGVEAAGDGLDLTLSDGSKDRVDRVVLATGYRIDVSKLNILDSSIREKIQRTPDGYPVLTTGLQTSLKGLYMAGVIAEKTLGPTLRFVTGTSNAGPRVAAEITGKRSVR